MAKQITTMTDSNGQEVPLKCVGKYDRQRDQVTRRILARFTKARQALEKVVAESIADLDALKGGKEKLGEKGNFSTSSFDGLNKGETSAGDMMVAKYIASVFFQMGFTTMDRDALAFKLMRPDGWDDFTDLQIKKVVAALQKHVRRIGVDAAACRV